MFADRGQFATKMGGTERGRCSEAVTAATKWAGTEGTAGERWAAGQVLAC